MIKTISIVLVLVLILGMVSVGLAVEDTWTKKADMPTARGFVSGTIVDGKIYVIGGFPTHNSVTSAVEMYDPTTDAWTSKAPMPAGRSAHATCTYNDKIYVFGGTSPDPYSTAKKNVFVYDPQTNTWSQKSDMPYANALCGVAVVDDRIYLVGGTVRSSSTPVSRLMAYDPALDSWTQKADMPTARSYLSACAVDGRIYAIGGAPRNYQSVTYKNVEVYDPETDSWSRKANMPTGRTALATCVVGGRIFAVGGFSPTAIYTANEMYNPVKDVWTIKSPMQQKRLMPFAGSVGNQVYVIGGSYPDSNMQPVILSTTEQYDTGSSSPDFNVDGIVDSIDVCILVEHWQTDNPLCDIAPPPFGDGIVDVKDLKVLAEHLFEVYPSAETVDVTEADNGGQVEVELGKLLAVTLESNPSTGYQWELVENNESVLKQFGQSEYKPPETTNPRMAGAGGSEIFRFKAISAGQTTLEFVYHRSWEDVEPLKTFFIQVTVP